MKHRSKFEPYGKYLLSHAKHVIDRHNERHVSGYKADHAPHPNTATTQNDDVQVFKKRKIGKAKIKKLKFQKKVQDAARKPQEFNLLHQYSTTATTAYSRASSVTSSTVQYQFPSQQSAAFGINLGALANNSDLSKIIGYINNPGTTGAPVAASSYVGRGIITASRHSLAIKSPTYLQEMDVYQFVAAIDIGDSAMRDPITAWNSLAASLTIASAGTLATSEFTGITPLDTPAFGRYWKLLNKQRVFLQPGSQVLLDMKKLPKFTYNAEEISNKYALKGKTMYWLIIGGVGNTVDVQNAGIVFTSVNNRIQHYKTTGDGINGQDRPYAQQELM